MSAITRAIVRTPAPTIADGLTTAGLGRPDHRRMLEQHAAYVGALVALGIEVETLEPLADFPDAHFVEDVALVLPELAVITRPGATQRRGEAAAIEAALAHHRPLRRIEAPATLDGGDVLDAGGHFFIGLSRRTDERGAEQLASILAEAGYGSTTVPVAAGLHLKSGVSWIGGRRLIVTAELALTGRFADRELTVVDRDDEYACNVVFVNGTVVMPAGFPRVRARLAELGLPTVELDASETRKMDGGLTCLSLRF